MCRELHVIGRTEVRLEKVFSITQREWLHVPALAYKNVEGEKDDACSRGGILESIETQLAFIVEGHQLTVESGADRDCVLQLARDQRIFPGEIFSSPGQ